MGSVGWECDEKLNWFQRYILITNAKSFSNTILKHQIFRSHIYRRLLLKNQKEPPPIAANNVMKKNVE